MQIICKLFANASSHQNYFFRNSETVCEAMFKVLAETALRGTEPTQSSRQNKEYDIPNIII